MGYYTDYTLSTDTYVPDLYVQLPIVTGYDNWTYNPASEKYYLSDSKWYSTHEDMIKISKMYPEVLFTLHGDGEESGDLWVNYYKNGLYQESKLVITYEECKL